MGHGTSGYAVVAIPSQDDYVWKLSSEKVPHLTLLFLGDNLSNVDHVVETIKHVADTSLCKFGLDVDHRGVLGDKSADVLFFKNPGYCVKRLEEVRSYLLGDTDILKAYNSTEQFPAWIPHLTMGYPDSPAHPDPRDYPGTTWVTFDRLALWMGEYEGVEFPLKNDEYDSPLAMSNLMAIGEDFLQHYGVKGMKWGVRRSTDSGPSAVEVRTRPGRRVKTSGGKRHPASEDAIRVAKTRQLAKKSTTDSLSNKELQELINRMNLEQQYKRLNGGSTLERGTKMVKTLIGIGRTGKEAADLGSTLLKDITK